MDIFDGPYIRHNKWLLTCFGLWPYQSKFQKIVIYFFFGTLLWSLVIPLIEGLADERSTNIVIRFETIVISMTVFGGFGQILSLHIRGSQLKQIYENINSDWQSLTDTNELKILHKFSREGKQLIYLFIGSTCGSYFLFILLTYVPLLVSDENIDPNNYSKPYPYYSSRWIINKNLQSLQVFLHNTLVLFCGGSVYIVVIATYICNIKHFCGMYAIIRYKLKNTIKPIIIESLTELKDDTDVISELFKIMENHKRIIRGTRLLIKTFGRTFFIVEICLLACLALIIFDIKYHIHQTRSMIRIFFIAIILITHLFYMNYGGEQIMQYSNEIYVASYFIKWYMLSVKARKILLIIICRTAKPENLNAGLTILSFENFAWIIKASWSLATVILTTLKKG